MSLLSFAAGCDAPAMAGGLANGADLTRVDVDVIANVDRIADTLRSHTPAVRVSALIDSAFPPALEELDWTASTSCPGGGCSWQDVLASLTAMYPPQVDESCAFAEEHAAITHAPAAFGPPCADHDTLSTNADVYDVTVEVAGTAYTMFDVAANWFANSTPADPGHCP